MRQSSMYQHIDLAVQGDFSAQFMLGYIYHQGKGVPKNIPKAIEWYTKAAEQGNVNAQLSLGWIYDSNGVTVEDREKAIKWYTKAAEQGNLTAQNNLGCIYSSNKSGILKDKIKGIEWYTKAAEYGNASSLRNLESEAKVGNAHAQYNLARMYQNGLGVTRDDKKARYWYKKAALKEYADAKHILKILKDTKVFITENKEIVTDITKDIKEIEIDIVPGILFKFKSDKSNNIYKIGNVKKIKNDNKNIYAVGINSIYNERYIKHTKIELLKFLIIEERITIVDNKDLNDNEFNGNIFFDATEKIDSINRVTIENQKKCITCIKKIECGSVEQMKSNVCEKSSINKLMAIEFNESILNTNCFFVKLSEDKSNEVFSIIRDIHSYDTKVTWSIKSGWGKTLTIGMSKDEVEELLNQNQFFLVSQQDTSKQKMLINYEKLKLFNSIIKSNYCIYNDKINFNNIIFYKFNNCKSSILAYDKNTAALYQIKMHTVNKISNKLASETINYMIKTLNKIDKSELENLEVYSECKKCITHNLDERRMYDELGILDKYITEIEYLTSKNGAPNKLKFTEEDKDICIWGEWKSRTYKYFIDHNGQKYTYSGVGSIYNYLKNNNYYPNPLTSTWRKYEVEPIINTTQDTRQILDSTRVKNVLDNLDIDPVTEIYYLNNYNKYWIYKDIRRYKNPKFSNVTGGYILDVKNGNECGITHYEKKLIDIFKKIDIKDTWITMVPSSKENTLNEGMCELLFKVVSQLNEIKFYQCLNRKYTIEKLSTGGNRSINTHLNSLEICGDTEAYEGIKIYLIDDVITTGNSMLACKKMLESIGGEVICIALGKTISEM